MSCSSSTMILSIWAQLHFLFHFKFSIHFGAIFDSEHLCFIGNVFWLIMNNNCSPKHFCTVRNILCLLEKISKRANNNKDSFRTIVCCSRSTNLTYNASQKYESTLLHTPPYACTERTFDSRSCVHAQQNIFEKLVYKLIAHILMLLLAPFKSKLVN